MARFHIGKDNWFLVIPAAILGLVALYTVHRMYQAGDIRRSIEVVTAYQAGTAPPLGEYLSREYGGAVSCEAEMKSRFYGTLDVRCRVGDSPTYVWRVHVGQRAFAPKDDATRRLMREYAPEIFAEHESGAQQ